MNTVCGCPELVVRILARQNHEDGQFHRALNTSTIDGRFSTDMGSLLGWAILPKKTIIGVFLDEKTFISVIKLLATDYHIYTEQEKKSIERSLEALKIRCPQHRKT